MRGGILQACAEAQIGSEGACPLFRLAIAKAMLSASAKYSTGEEQSLFKISDIQRLAPTAEKQRLVEKAESYLVRMRNVLTDADVKPPLWSTVCGLFDVRVVHHVCSKVDESRGQYKSLAALGHAWVQDLSTMLQRPVGCPTEWAQDAPSSAEGTSAKVASGIKVFTQSGSWENSAEMIKAKGFKAEQRLRHGDKCYTLVAITDENVDVKDDKDVITSIPHGKFVKDKWAPLNTRHNLVSDILAHDPQQNVEWLSNLCEATAKVALAELWESNKECLRKLEVVTAPKQSRAVRAKEHLAVGKVCLVPCTSSIAVKKVGDALPSGSVRLNGGFDHPTTQKKYSAVLLPSGGVKLPDGNSKQKASSSSDGFSALQEAQPTFLAPFWFVTTVGHEDHANMHVKLRIVHGLKVPVYVNKNVLKVGDALKVFVAPPESKGAPEAKRQRT